MRESEKLLEGILEMTWSNPSLHDGNEESSDRRELSQYLRLLGLSSTGNPIGDDLG